MKIETLSFLSSLACVSLLQTTPAPAAKCGECPERRTIAVTGNAEVRVIPDEVVVSFGVETSSTRKLEDAKQANDTIVSKAIELIKANGIESKFVQTDNISYEPRYIEKGDNRFFAGFFARKGISVTLKDTSKLEKIISDALAAGVNNINGVNFRTTELRKHRDNARTLAIKAAKEKAHLLAAQLGEQIGRPVSIQENAASYSPYYSWWGGYAAQNVSQNVSSMAPGAAGEAASDTGPTPLGMISVNAAVSVTFELTD
ncbi:MAG: SIMPL domain-containing protein [Candidatus Sumerlaeota bacterium]|nr:SIMPL domain-containing protein [Candidatus Sumerlaeota bacterium]